MALPLYGVKELKTKSVILYVIIIVLVVLNGQIDYLRMLKSPKELRVDLDLPQNSHELNSRNKIWHHHCMASKI